jgi:hypothetical protein
MTTPTTRRTARKSRLSAEQIAVCEARALFETVKADCIAEDIRRGITYPEGMTLEQETAMDLAAHEIRVERGYYLARRAVVEAERAVVAWCIEHARRYSPAHAALLADVQERAERSAVYGPKLVELAMRLAA